jgi:hypothetical protein
MERAGKIVSNACMCGKSSRNYKLKEIFFLNLNFENFLKVYGGKYF